MASCGPRPVGLISGYELRPKIMTHRNKWPGMNSLVQVRLGGNYTYVAKLASLPRYLIAK